MWPQPLLLLFFLSFTPRVSQALFEEAGRSEWFTPHVGFVLDAHFQTGKTVTLASELGVLASLNLRTNTFVWRSLLPNEEVAEVVIPSSDSRGIFTLSGNGKHASLWNAGDGQLLWSQDLFSFADIKDKEQLVSGSGSSRSARFVRDLNKDGASEILVLSHNRVQVLSGKDGRMIMSSTTPIDSQFHHAFLYQSKQGELLAVLGYKETEREGKATYSLTLLDPVTGRTTRSSIPIRGTVSNTSECEWIEDQRLLFCFDPTGAHLLHARIDPSRPDDIEFKPFVFDGFNTNSHDEILSIVSYHDGLIIRFSNQDVIYGIKDSTIAPLHYYPRNQFRAYDSFVLRFPNAAKDTYVTYLAAASMNESGVFIDIIDCNAKKIVHSINDASITSIQHGPINKVFLEVVVKKDGALQYRALVVCQDHSLSLLTGHKLNWIREEALAGVVNTKMIELPASQALRQSLQKEFGDEEVEGVPLFGNLIKRIGFEVQQLLTLIGMHDNNKKEDQQKVEVDEALTKNKFGLRKLIIIATRAGKIFALRSTDGSVVWAKFIRNSFPLAIFLSRSSAHPPPIGVVINRDLSSGAGFVLQINLLTGEEVEPSKMLQQPVKQSTMLPFIDSNHCHPVLLLDATNQGHIIPDTQENRNLVSNNADKIFIYIVDKEKSSVEGYGINGGLAKAMMLLWNVHFPSSNEVIETIATSGGLSVGLPVLIRGDNSVTPKYLNKNLLAIATSSTNTFLSANKRVVETSVGIYLIDTVTGAIVHHSYHKNAHGPVHMVQGDNWIVYHVWNKKLHRFEMTVLELFEQQMDWQTTTFSSRTAPLPAVVSQSYVFNTGIKTMAVTNTARGLTGKQVLVGLSSGRLVGIDKRFLDFRRKPKELLTEEDKNEGVIPYMPELSFRFTEILNRNNTLFGLRGIQTAPASLESTSLVFSWGVDMFYTQVTPSGAFDMLNEDFEFMPLIVTMVVVAVLTLITSYLVAHKNLREAWQ